MRSGSSLVILAGGLSRRMGRDKAALPAGDGTLLEHLVRRLAPMVDETIIAGGSGRPALDGVRLVEDRYPHQGPLAGIHAGLLATRCPSAFVVACDLPDVEPALLRLLEGLAADHEAVVPRIDGRPEGACALYQRGLASRIEELLQAGERSITALLARSRVRYVDAEELAAADPALRSFRNINTVADFQAWLGTRAASR
jgi:molybdopterin-guanine dinucleotide biosynthesis protein A